MTTNNKDVSDIKDRFKNEAKIMRRRKKYGYSIICLILLSIAIIFIIPLGEIDRATRAIVVLMALTVVLAIHNYREILRTQKRFEEILDLLSEEKDK